MTIGIATALVIIAGPLLLGIAELLSTRGKPAGVVPDRTTAWNWKLTISSALLYALAFNLTFFIQELFLVLPKALTPGLYPTLFHNNHTWEGDNPLASLLQGSGALAILATGIVCALLVRRASSRSTTVRLFLVWMAYNGFFQALPQIVVGAINPGNDVGMAMAYLGLGTATRTALALVALAAIPAVALWLTRPLLSVADDPADTAGGRSRTGFIFRVATLPAVIAIPLIIPFRVPRAFIEVVIVPVVVTVIGIAWMQAGAWRTGDVTPERPSGAVSVGYPFGALVLLLLIFQLLLRPGVPFY